MKKVLTIVLVVVLVLSIGITAYATSTDTDANEVIEEVKGRFGFKGRGERLPLDKELMDELKDLTSEERLALLDSKLEAEEITQEAYDRLKIAIENGFTFEPPMHGRGSEKLFDRELMDELKGLTSEEQLTLLDSKLETEEITQEAYDKLKIMIENGCTFEPPVKSNNENGKGSGRIKPALEQNTESI